MIIKFNLITKTKEEVFEKVPEKFIFLKIYALLLCITILIIVIVGMCLSIKVNTLIKEKKAKQAQLQKYKLIVKNVELFKKQNEEIKKRISTILALKKKQDVPLKVISYLMDAIKNNKILFTHLKLTSSTVQIKGIALDLEDVANYLKNLEINKKLIKDVNLVNTVRKTHEKFAYIEFSTNIRY
ncbi:hypothetical protein DRN73_01810 [Candidatus Pacearchaeota archaeon]|nr:MAG: hypothetical protein DRN73_01810 [Candidatus Pacearchaeota archaeon]